jgi:hypothetical protein
LILIFLCCQGKGYDKKQTFECHYYPLLQSHLERWDANNHQIKFCSVTKYHITEAGSKDLGSYFLLSLSFRSLWKTSAWHPCGINQLAMEHTLFQLKYQSLLKQPSTRLDKHVVNKKTISSCLYIFFFIDFIRFGIAFVKVRVLSINDTIQVPLFTVLLWDVTLYQF